MDSTCTEDRSCCAVLAATVVIASAAHPDRGPLARVLALPPLVGAGLISYGLYLYHWPIYLVLTHARTGLSGWWLLGTRVIVSTAVAIISYALVEQPIRSGALRPARAFTALATATAVVVGALVVTTRVPIKVIPVPAAASSPGAGRPWPRATAAVVPGTIVRSFLPPGDWSRLTNTCEASRQLPPVKKLGPIRQPKILLAGDSVGCFIGASLDEHQVDDRVVTLNRAQLGCPLVEPKRERDASETALPTYPACVDGIASAVAAFDPDVSVLLVGGPMVHEYDIGTGGFVGPCDADFAPWYRAGARRSIAALSATGAKVVVVSIVQPPSFIDIGPGVTVPAAYGRDVECLNRMLEGSRGVGAERAVPRSRCLHLPGRQVPDEARRRDPARRRPALPGARGQPRRGMDASPPARRRADERFVADRARRVAAAVRITRVPR